MSKAFSALRQLIFNVVIRDGTKLGSLIEDVTLRNGRSAVLTKVADNNLESSYLRYKARIVTSKNTEFINRDTRTLIALSGHLDKAMAVKNEYIFTN